LQFFFDASIIGHYVGISIFQRSNAYIGASGRPKAHASAHLWMMLVNPPQPLFVACCKSNNETTKARRYRFLKQSEEMKLTYYLELKKTQ
jgi:hypothetical protein